MWGSDCMNCVYRVAAVVLIVLVILVVLCCMCYSASRSGSSGMSGGAMGGARKRRSGGHDDDECDERDDDSADDSDDESVEGGKRGKDLAVREPLFQSIVDGKVKVIGRINRGPFKEIKEGDQVTIRRSRPKGDTTEYPGARRFKATITSRKDYASAEKMIDAEGAAKMYPGVKSADKAVEAFRGEFHTEADEKEHGVVAFHIKKE